MTAAATQFRPRYLRTPAQRRLDELVDQKTREAAAYFESRRVPGLTYKVSSTIDLKGAMVLTWTPEPVS